MDVPESLLKQISDTIFHLKKVFNYRKILLLYEVEAGKFSVIDQTDRKKYSAFTFEGFKSEDDLNRAFVKHFGVKGLIPYSVGKSNRGFLAIDYEDSDNLDDKLKVTRFFTHSIQDCFNNQLLVKNVDRNTEQIRRMIGEITTLHEFTRALESGENIDILLKTIMEKTSKIMNAEAASMMLVVEGGKELEFKVTLGPKAAEVKPFRLAIGKGIAGWVAKTGKPVLIPDAYKDSRFDPSFDQRSGFVTRSILCVPMIYNNSTVGVMTVLNRTDGKPFSDNDQTLLTIFASQAALAIQNTRLLVSQIEKERLDKELQVASDIQKLLIPQSIPKIKEMDISATYIPCKEVSGDFYDIISLKDGRSIFVCADVSGKGIPGAMVVSNMQATLRAYLEYSTDLISVVTRLNENVIKHTTSDRYITFFIGIFDPATKKFEYINAGHNPPLHVSKEGRVEKLKTGGIFLGFMPFEYEKSSIRLKSGDILALFTDGLVETMDNTEEEFGDDRLEKVLLKTSKKNSAAIQKAVITAVQKHQEGQQLEDDFTLIISKIL